MKKRILVIILILTIIIPINIEAKTLGEYRAELEALQKQYEDNQASIARTDEEIAAANARVQEIYGEIDSIEGEMIEINKEISKLNGDILSKDKEIKDLMRYYQFSNGESIYLEYMFSADSITDFIYRYSVTEQLSKYNDQLISEMHDLIEKNKVNISNLQEKEQSLKNLQVELNKQLVILGNERQQLGDESLSIQEEVEAQMAIVKQYEDMGCEENQEVSTCGKESLPIGTNSIDL